MKMDLSYVMNRDFENLKEEDIKVISLIRGLRALTGNWYDKEICKMTDTPEHLKMYFNSVLNEFTNETDRHENEAQSPNDISSSGKMIIDALRVEFTQMYYKPDLTIVYRLLGGLRGVMTSAIRSHPFCMLGKMSINLMHLLVRMRSILSERKKHKKLIFNDP